MTGIDTAMAPMEAQLAHIRTQLANTRHLLHATVDPLLTETRQLRALTTLALLALRAAHHSGGCTCPPPGDCLLERQWATDLLASVDQTVTHA